MEINEKINEIIQQAKEEGTFTFKSLDKVDNYEPFVNLFEAYVVGNKFDKED